MSNIIKPIFIILFFSIFFQFTTSKSISISEDKINSELTYAIKTATQDATLKLLDENNFLDGNTKEYQDMDYNLDSATNQFLKSFYINIGSDKKTSKIRNMNMPLTGYVGYKYIIGKTYEGNYTYPMSYVYSTEKAIYNFTLGDKVFITNIETNNETISNLSEMPILDKTLNNKEFRNYIIMNTINKFLTTFSSSDYSIMAQNENKELKFQLAHADYVVNDNTKLNLLSSVIDGPGFFCLIDLYDNQITGNNKRVFSFGGSEIYQKNVKN